MNDKSVITVRRLLRFWKYGVFPIKKKVEDLNTDLVAVDGAFPLTSEFSIVSNRFSLQKKNKRVVLNMMVMRSAVMGAGGTYGIGNIASANNDFKPKQALQFPCTMDDGGSKKGLGIIQISVDGSVTISPITSGTSWTRVLVFGCWDV